MRRFIVDKLLHQVEHLGSPRCRMQFHASSLPVHLWDGEVVEWIEPSGSDLSALAEIIMQGREALGCALEREMKE